MRRRCATILVSDGAMHGGTWVADGGDGSDSTDRPAVATMDGPYNLPVMQTPRALRSRVGCTAILRHAACSCSWSLLRPGRCVARRRSTAARRCWSSATRSPPVTDLPPGTGWVTLLAERARASERYRLRRSSTRASAATPPPAAARGCRRCSRSIDPAIVVIELGGNDGLRGGDLEATRDNLDAMVDARKRRARKVLLVGMRVPPNYGSAYTSRFDALYRRRRGGASKVPLVPFLFEGFAERRRRCSSPIASTRRVAAQPRLLDNVWPALAPLLAQAALMPVRDRKVGGGATPARFPTALDVRSPREFAAGSRAARDQRARARTTPSARASARCTRRCRRSPRARLGAAIVARNIATHRRDASRATSRATGRRSSTAGAAASAARALAHVLGEIGFGARRSSTAAIARVAATSSPRWQRAAGALALRRRLRPHRHRQEPAHRCARATAARRCSTSKASRSHRGSLLGDDPQRPQPSQKHFETGMYDVLARARSRTAGVRRVGEPAHRPAAGARRAARRDARRAAAYASRRRCRCASRSCSDDYAHLRGAIRRASSAPRATRAAVRQGHDRALAGRPQRAATSTRWSTELLALHYDPTYARSIARNFPRVERAPSLCAGARSDARRVRRARARRDRALTGDSHCHIERMNAVRPTHFRIVNVFAESPLAGNPLCVFEDGDGARRRRRCRRSRCSSTCRRRRSSCRRRGATARVRIFTPTFEMPFAGHPTLGTAHVVRALARRRRGDARDAGRRHPGRTRAAIAGRWRRTRPASRAPAATRRSSPRCWVSTAARHRRRTPLWVDTGSSSW